MNDDNDLLRRVHIPLVAVYALMGIIVLLVVGILSYAVSNHAAHSASKAATVGLAAGVRRAQIATVAGCDRNQVLRGYLLLRARDLKRARIGTSTSDLALDYLAIVDCYSTYVTNVAGPNAGQVTYLSRPLEACFLRLLETKAFGDHAENVTTSPARLHVEFNCT